MRKDWRSSALAGVAWRFRALFHTDEQRREAAAARPARVVPARAHCRAWRRRQRAAVAAGRPQSPHCPLWHRAARRRWHRRRTRARRGRADAGCGAGRALPRGQCRRASRARAHRHGLRRTGKPVRSDPSARALAREPDRRVADVPVFGARRLRHRLASRALGSVADVRRGPVHDRGHGGHCRRPHHAGLSGPVRRRDRACAF